MEMALLDGCLKPDGASANLHIVEERRAEDTELSEDGDTISS